MVFCSIKESLAPFTQERTHKYWNGSLPILRQWWFTQRSIYALKTNRHEFTQKAGAVAPKEACWYTSQWWCRHFQGVSTVSPLSIRLLHLEGRSMFSGGKFTDISVGRTDHCGDLFSSQTLGELKGYSSVSLIHGLTHLDTEYDPPSRDKVCGPLAYVLLASEMTAQQQYTAVNGSEHKSPSTSHK